MGTRETDTVYADICHGLIIALYPGTYDLTLPKPSAGSLAILAATGDVDKACKADMVEDIVTLGTNWGTMAGRMPTNLEIIGSGIDFLDLTIQGESLEDQFKK